jgi:membrane-bound lytic murein transglycosylase MltF
VKGKFRILAGISIIILLVASVLIIREIKQPEVEEPVKPVQPPAVDLELASHFSEQYTDDLPGLMKRRTIRVLTTFNKTNYFLHKNQQHGFEYSLMSDYEKFLNRKIKKGLKVVVEFRPVSRNVLIPLLNKGYGDIAAAGLTITAGRKEVVDFTSPYLTDIDEVVVSHKNVVGLDNPEDLVGRKLYVRESSSYFESIRTLNEILKEKGLKPVKVIKADESLETEDILEIVNSGALDLTVADNHIAEIWATVLEDIRVHEAIKLREQGMIAWMVRKSNPELASSLNSFIRKRKKGSRIGNIYFNRYFEDNKWIQNPISEKQVGKLHKYEELIKKYAGQYGFDWMLIMAVGFQESGLNNNKRSRAGAVGVMQVRPSTARDRNVGISDVHLVENNIHAGVKYLAWVRDRYFSDDNIREGDRIRFTLAAYNAGPKSINRARRRAREMKLDDTLWFRNVEVAALKVIGREPVQYVGNINKYYVIYKLYETNQQVREQIKGDLG